MSGRWLLMTEANARYSQAEDRWTIRVYLRDGGEAQIYEKGQTCLVGREQYGVDDTSILR
jgi:hypothetical protein